MVKRGNGSGSVYRRADTGRWVASVTVEGRRLTATASTQSEARRKLVELKAAPVRPVSSGTVGGVVQAWLSETLPVLPLAPATRATYATLLRGHVLADPLADVSGATRRDVEAWLKRLVRKGVAPSTARQAFVVLRQALRHAAEVGDLQADPTAGMRPPSATYREVAWLQPDEVAAVLRKIPAGTMRDVAELLAVTGLRRGEALGLAWGDVDRARKVVRVRRSMNPHGVGPTKTSSGTRTVPLTAAVEAVLARRPQGGPDAPIFTDPLTGRPPHPRNVTRAVSDAGRRAGHPGIGPHTLRHSAASIMLAEGVPLVTVSRMLGHSSVAITGDTYGHVADAGTFGAADSLGRAIQPGAR